MSNHTALPTFLERHRILSVEQAAEMMGFSVAHVRRMYRTGKLPKPMKIGGRKGGWQAGVLIDLIADRASRTQEAA